VAEFSDEHINLLDAIYNLAHLIEQTNDPVKIAQYVEQLSKLKAKLIALGP